MTDAPKPDAGTLYLERLDVLEREIKRQRAVLIEHGVAQRDKRSWEDMRRKHDLRVRPLADHHHVVKSMLEDLRFDVDVLVQDFRRFFSSVERERPIKPRGAPTA